MGNNAWSYNAKERSFTLRAKKWSFTDVAKLLDKDINRPQNISFKCAVHETFGLVCTIYCANEQDFVQMKSELERVLE